MSNITNDKWFDRASQVIDELGPNHYISEYIYKAQAMGDMEELALKTRQGEEEIGNQVKYDLMMDNARDILSELEQEGVDLD